MEQQINLSLSLSLCLCLSLSLSLSLINKNFKSESTFILFKSISSPKELKSWRLRGLRKQAICLIWIYHVLKSLSICSQLKQLPLQMKMTLPFQQENVSSCWAKYCTVVRVYSTAFMTLDDFRLVLQFTWSYMLESCSYSCIYYQKLVHEILCYCSIRKVVSSQLVIIIHYGLHWNSFFHLVIFLLWVPYWITSVNGP